jgi:hypothetical protein
MLVWKIAAEMSKELEEEISEREKKFLEFIVENNTFHVWEDEDAEKNTSYIICENNVLEMVESLFLENHITYTKEDVTEDFLMGILKIPCLEFREYREAHIDVDIVLDKIRKYGIDSLDESDKSVLNSIK